MPDRKLARRTVAFLAVCAVAVALAALDSFRDYLLAPWHRRVLLEGDFRASSRAADRLAKIGAIETTPLLMRAYAEKDPYSEWNHYIVAMQHFLDLDPERTVTLVASCLRDPAAPVRLSAAFFLDGSCDYPGTDGLCIARFAVRRWSRSSRTRRSTIATREDSAFGRSVESAARPARLSEFSEKSPGPTGA